MYQPVHELRGRQAPVSWRLFLQNQCGTSATYRPYRGIRPHRGL